MFIIKCTWFIGACVFFLLNIALYFYMLSSYMDFQIFFWGSRKMQGRGRYCKWGGTKRHLVPHISIIIITEIYCTLLYNITYKHQNSCLTKCFTNSICLYDSQRYKSSDLYALSTSSCNAACIKWEKRMRASGFENLFLKIYSWEVVRVVVRFPATPGSNPITFVLDFMILVTFHTSSMGLKR